MNEYQPRCSFCGRLQELELEPYGFYGKLDPTDEESEVEVFCDEAHYVLYQWTAVLQST